MAIGILVSKDLMFISKVKEVGVAAGAEIKVARSLDALERSLSEVEGPGALMIDLEKSGIPQDALTAPVSQLLAKGWKVVSFFSHIHEELGGEADQRGLGEVMPRSKFVRVLPSLLGL